MKIAVVGSRDYFPLSDVDDYINSLPLDTTIVSGNAKGVDQRAEQAARKRGMEVISLPADWANLGPGAGIIRNRKIVDLADVVVAFWDLKSRGTADTIQVADKHGKLRKVNISLPKAIYIANKIRGGAILESHLL